MFGQYHDNPASTYQACCRMFSFEGSNDQEYFSTMMIADVLLSSLTACLSIRYFALGKIFRCGRMVPDALRQESIRSPGSKSIAGIPLYKTKKSCWLLRSVDMTTGGWYISVS